MSGILVIPANCFQSPSATCRSEWQTPQASTWINTSSLPGLGFSISSTAKGFFSSRKTAAFINSVLLKTHLAEFIFDHRTNFFSTPVCQSVFLLQQLYV